MTTHLRVRAAQAGAVLALIGGMLAVASSPALADDPDPDVQITGVDSTTLQPGASTAIHFTVTNRGQTPAQVQVQVTGGNGLNCTGGCSPSALVGPGDGSKAKFDATVTAPQVPAGQNKTFQVTVLAQIGDGSDKDTSQIIVRGPDKPQTVRQVSGKVKDDNGKAVSGATVGLRDSQGHTYTQTSNDEGRFSFTATDSAQIAVGNLFVGAIKDNYKQVTVQVQGRADQNITQNLTMRLLASTASPSASASPTASPPADDETTDATPDVASPPPAQTQNTASTDKGSSSMLFIILGALLVAAGIGTILLLWMRRRNKGGGGDFPDDPDGGPNGPIPASQGRFNDATRVAAPVGGMNQTMIGGARSGPSLADAPTMLQQAVPVEDEFPDPYGVPAPQNGYAGPGGYGTAAAAGGYGAGAYGGAQVPAQYTGYDADPPTQFTAADDPYAAYGAPQGAAGGYGGAADQPRYDEATGMYRPEPGAYDGPPPAQPGYDDGGYRGGYGQEPEYPPAAGGRGPGEASGAYQAGAYPAGGGYGGADQQPADQGGYGSWGAPASPPAGGYSQGGSGGYGGGAAPAPGQYGGAQRGRSEDDYGDQGGYDPRSTYGRPDAYDGGQQQYGGDQQQLPAGGYGGDQGGYGADPQQYGGQQGGPQQGGPQQGGGYYGADQGGGRHGGQPRQQPPAPDPNRPAPRRSNEWLDD